KSDKKNREGDERGISAGREERKGSREAALMVTDLRGAGGCDGLQLFVGVGEVVSREGRNGEEVGRGVAPLLVFRRRGYGVLRQLENKGRDEMKEVNGAVGGRRRGGDGGCFPGGFRRIVRGRRNGGLFGRRESEGEGFGVVSTLAGNYGGLGRGLLCARRRRRGREGRGERSGGMVGEEEGK
ncbi:hypothetical protein HAX54_040379, partial [Datura stramonium]|nr:hypothetical protein [Datura stramonium]